MRALSMLLALTLAQTPKPVVISAEQLAREYEENEVAADAHYKGKLLEVTGKVIRVQRHVEEPEAGLPEVLLDAGGDVGIAFVACTWRKGEPENVLVPVRKGRKVTLRCVGDGRPVNVELRECVPVKL